MSMFDLLPKDMQLKLFVGKINTILRESGRADLVGQFEFKWVEYQHNDAREDGIALKPLTPAAEQYLKENTVMTIKKGE